MNIGAIAGVRLSRVSAVAGGALLFIVVLSAQERPPQRIGGPDDWTHRRLVFSDPGTAEEAARHGTLDRWLRIVNDPRYILQRAKREAARESEFNFAKILRPAEPRTIVAPEPCRRVASSELQHPRRGLTQLGKTPLIPFVYSCGSGNPAHGSNTLPQALHTDWSENMGTGATVGLGMFPAKYSFDISSASCAGAAQPDFVVYNTGVEGTSSQASIVAYDNLYSGCSGTAPSTYWAYNTGGTVATSVVLSGDGTQVAFAQTGSDGSASLVVLKWAASSMESAGSPGTPTSKMADEYRGCSAPCSVTLAFSGSPAPSDTLSSVFYDYSSDNLYVGDDSGKLHKFSGVFTGTPAEATTPWPVSVSSNPLSAPIYDSYSGNIFVGDYSLDTTESDCVLGNPCGYFYSVNASSGTIAGTSGRLDQNFGIVDTPLVDATGGKAYVFVGDDGSSGCSASSPCSGVFQFSTSFASGDGIEAQVGPGNQIMLSGALDNQYFSSSDAATPTGNLYVVGNTGAANNTLFQIPITLGVMSTTANTGPVVSTNYTSDTQASAGLQVTEIYTGSKDYIFLSVLIFGAPASCDASLDNGCVMGFDVTSGTISGSTVPTGATAEMNGTSGIIIDNASAFSGASNIYYTPLADETCATSESMGGCAIQISQASP